jgi:hypothetical protein
MIKGIISVIAFVLIAFGLSSCEGLFGNCKVCSLNYYENGAMINSVSEAEYCDTDLIAIEAIADEDMGGGVVAKWECN